MMEFFIYLCGIIYAGYFTGITFVKLFKKAIFNYEFKYYSYMVLNIMIMFLLPLMFLGMVILMGLCYEFYFILTTGQL